MDRAKEKIMAVRRWMRWSCVLALAVVGCSEKVVERAETRPLVRVGAARQGVTFVDALRVQGTVRAKDAAGVSARIPGTIDAVFVDEGARVKKGDVETGMLVGEIVAQQADESVLTDGKIDLGKLQPIIFDASYNAYRVVGEIVGNAFKDGMQLK